MSKIEKVTPNKVNFCSDQCVIVGHHFTQLFLIRLIYNMPGVPGSLVAEISEVDNERSGPTMENCALWLPSQFLPMKLCNSVSLL